MLISRLLLIVSLLLAPLAGAGQSIAHDILPADVRLVIDISGSMKNTDPQNLRRPAMELLVKLLPDQSRAGVWAFGESVHTLMPHAMVNGEWRDQATAKASSITSTSMWTNIGAALEQASYDIGRADNSFRNNIILLTDGMVDINPSAETNSVERQRVINEVLPRLQQAGYIIHTIALSDAADHELMEAISLATDGVFAVVHNADQLLSTFLRIFDQAVPQVRLPLESNRFLVDATVEEFTALIFRKVHAQPTELTAPDGQKYTAANSPNAINWYRTASYDLITVTKPVPGEWQVSAEIDPDSRVTVVSNLQLAMQPLKNNIEVSQALDLNFEFLEDDNTVVDPQFLQLLAMDIKVTRSTDGRQWQQPIINRAPPIDGKYQHPLELFRETGTYTVQLLIDGKTFKREYLHRVTVGSPFAITMEKTLRDGRVVYDLRVTTDDQRVEPAKTVIVAQLKDSTGRSSLHNFAPVDNGSWQLALTPDISARYSVGVQVSGGRRDGQPIKETLSTQFFSYPDKDDPFPAPEINTPVAEAVTEAREDLPADEMTEAEPEAIVATPSGNKYWLMYLSIGLANVLVFGMAWFAFRMVMGKKAKNETEEIEETLNVDVQKIMDAKQPAMQEVDDAPAATTIDIAQEHAVPKATADADDDFNDFLADDFPIDDSSETDKK